MLLRQVLHLYFLSVDRCYLALSDYSHNGFPNSVLVRSIWDSQINQQRQYLLLIQHVIVPPLASQLMNFRRDQKSDHDGHSVGYSTDFSRYWLIEFHRLFRALDMLILDANSCLGQVTGDDQFFHFV